jgi:hypothetical protein
MMYRGSWVRTVDFLLVVLAAGCGGSRAPTVLSDEDKRRDRAREPLAAAVVDAFPNSNGLFSSLVARWSPDGSAIVYG